LPKSSNPSLRAAQPADADAITRLINSAFQVENFFKRGDRLDLVEVQARIAKGRFILAEQSGVIVGCVYLESGAERAYIGLLSVDPSQQGSGLGKRLMAAAEEYCRAAGSNFVDLRVVNLRTELPPFYRKLGYQQTGTEPFPAEAHTEMPCHFLIMSKSL
jgi:N-acetylglutamate synthase-like GNAT family acetyltransferase